MCEVRSREKRPRTKINKIQWSATKRNGLRWTPSGAEWKNATHLVDRTANWCIGGCWFTLAAKDHRWSPLLWAWVTQHPPLHHPKSPVAGFYGWDETVPQGSVYLVSSFFSHASFFPRSHYFSSHVSFFIFGVPPSLNPIFFLGTPTYSSSVPPFHHPTHLPPPTYPITHFHSPPWLEL